MKLLVVEDDRETAAYLVKGLSESGYTVDQSGDGRDGLFLATSGSYDAIILDRMLPGMDGLALLGALRARRDPHPGADPVARSAASTTGSRGCAPAATTIWSSPSRSANCWRGSRRCCGAAPTAPTTTRLRVADLELDLLTRTVKRGDKAIELLPREFQLLEYLMRNAGHVVTRTMLLETCVGLSFRPADQCHRRACQPAAAKDRQEFRHGRCCTRCAAPAIACAPPE